MPWCSACLQYHDEVCLDESRRREVINALLHWFRGRPSTRLGTMHLSGKPTLIGQAVPRHRRP